GEGIRDRGLPERRSRLCESQRYELRRRGGRAGVGAYDAIPGRTPRFGRRLRGTLAMAALNGQGHQSDRAISACGDAAPASSVSHTSVTSRGCETYTILCSSSLVQRSDAWARAASIFRRPPSAV